MLLSIILFVVFVLLIVSLIATYIIMFIIDVKSSRLLEKYLFDNNIKEDLVFLKIVDSNMVKRDRIVRPLLFLRYLKMDTDDKELKKMKSKYSKTISSFTRILIILLFSIIIVIEFMVKLSS